MPNVTVTNSTPIKPAQGTNHVISVAAAPVSALTSGSTSLGTTTPTPTGQPPKPPMGALAAIPSLTDEQKRIVQEFKQKMALLPADQQSAYIAQHKASLIKQLNFQPSQLQLLRSNTAQLQLSVKMRPQLQPQVGVVPPGGQVSNIQPPPQATTMPTLQPHNISLPMLPTTPLPPGTLTGAKLEGGPSHPPNILATASVTTGTAPAPNKQKNLAWVESQLKKDQNEAVNPHVTLPFKSKEDACKRLLRYHVFNELDPSPEEMWMAEEDYEDQSAQLINKCEDMLNKYHYLLAHESMRMAASCEEVMLARLWDTDERQTFAREKEEVRNGSSIDLTMLTAEQRAEYAEHLAKKEQEELKKVEAEAKAELEQATQLIALHKSDNDEQAIANESRKRPRSPADVLEVHEGDRDDDDIKEEEEPLGPKLGIKFARSVSGNWRKKVKLRDEEEPQQVVAKVLPADDNNYYASLKDELNKFDSVVSTKQKEDALFQQNLHGQPPDNGNTDSDSEGFSLKDVDTQKAVGTIINAPDSPPSPPEDPDMGDIGTADEDDVVAAAFGADSVQNAINSILVDGDRIDTPDINNITGLLDSIDDQDDMSVAERDPVTEAAVNSIPQF